MPRKPAKAPVQFTPDVIKALFRRLADGESLRAIEKDPNMPSARAVRYRVLEDDDFAAAYFRARDVGLDTLADEVIAIADGVDSSGDVIRDRLRFDARRWYLSKLAPKQYGERLQHEVNGGIDLRAAMQKAEARRNQLARERGLVIDAESGGEDITR
ncbi:MAG TPA: hypothetical protein VFL97_07210 [Nitrococcus sp.]|nr:hypothetical protein [Nitrococcus sp.]